eukprot:TRINITY_DN5565_c0_g1_i1.p2 TRINITY_DN5565_c0_g1~~TRINITY_DN5565_c0_g1_i1.p2  ORF type:complete len:441 (-),score=130.90 TRINITY_DN5565_c0_g1_i1:15-1298(-)
MLDPGYFVGRVELLRWINELLRLDFVKIEQACSGWPYCQVIDSLYPNVVNMLKVNFAAKTEMEYTQNFQILKTAFEEIGIQKRPMIEKLVKGRTQDNLEFIQFMKRYFEMYKDNLKNYEPYDAELVRQTIIKEQERRKSLLAKRSIVPRPATSVRLTKAAQARLEMLKDGDRSSKMQISRDARMKDLDLASPRKSGLNKRRLSSIYGSPPAYPKSPSLCTLNMSPMRELKALVVTSSSSSPSTPAFSSPSTPLFNLPPQPAIPADTPMAVRSEPVKRQRTELAAAEAEQVWSGFPAARAERLEFGNRVDMLLTFVSKLEKERMEMFGKMALIEELLREHPAAQGNPLAQLILPILRAKTSSSYDENYEDAGLQGSSDRKVEEDGAVKTEQTDEIKIEDEAPDGVRIEEPTVTLEAGGLEKPVEEQGN